LPKLLWLQRWSNAGLTQRTTAEAGSAKAMLPLQQLQPLLQKNAVK